MSTVKISFIRRVPLHWFPDSEFIISVANKVLFILSNLSKMDLVYYQNLKYLRQDGLVNKIRAIENTFFQVI